MATLRAWAPGVFPVYGLDVEHHGGGCCGVKHLYGFPDAGTKEERLKWVKEAIPRCLNKFGDYDGDENWWRGCIEVTLNEEQLHKWNDVLEEVGFKQVFSWLNHNSGNHCYMYLLETNRPK